MMGVALALALGAGSTAALAEGSPDLNRPFRDDFYTSLGKRIARDTVAALPVASEADARDRLEANGYRSVNGLARATDGAWHATARRGSVVTKVTVLPDGRVFSH